MLLQRRLIALVEAAAIHGALFRIASSGSARRTPRLLRRLLLLLVLVHAVQTNPASRSSHSSGQIPRRGIGTRHQIRFDGSLDRFPAVRFSLREFGRGILAVSAMALRMIARRRRIATATAAVMRGRSWRRRRSIDHPRIGTATWRLVGRHLILRRRPFFHLLFRLFVGHQSLGIIIIIIVFQRHIRILRRILRKEGGPS